MTTKIYDTKNALSKRIKSMKSVKIKKIINDQIFKHPGHFLFYVVCLLGCAVQLLNVINEFLRYNIAVEIDIDSNDFSYMPAVTISNDFFMFLNMTKVDETFKDWSNLSTLAKTRKFLSLQNITSAFKFQFLYNPQILFENCTVYDIYSTNFTEEQELKYSKVSEKFRTKIADKEEFADLNLADPENEFDPPYVIEKKCKEIGDFYLRTEYKDLSGWSNHLWYLTLFYRPAELINDNKFKFTKMSNELLLKLKWDILVTENIEFGFKIHIHSPTQSPNSKTAATLGINGQAFKWVTIGYSHSTANFLKPPFKTNCYDYTEYNFTSRQNCIDSCKIQLTKSHCNTLPLFTLMEPEFTVDFINRKENVDCFYKFNINLYCEQRCFQKECVSEYYTASILSEVSQSEKTFGSFYHYSKYILSYISLFFFLLFKLVIDIIKPNIGINEERYNYIQKMKPLELFLYAGSTLSLWFGVTIYFGLRTFSNYFSGLKKFISGKKECSSKPNIFRKVGRIFARSSSRQKSPRTLSNRTLNSLLSYRSSLNALDKAQNTGFNTKFKDKLNAFNYEENVDFNYSRNNLSYFNNQMRNDQVKFIILRDKNNNQRFIR